MATDPLTAPSGRSSCGGDAFQPTDPRMRKPMVLGESWPSLCRYCAKSVQVGGKCGEIEVKG